MEFINEETGLAGENFLENQIASQCKTTRNKLNKMLEGVTDDERDVYF